MAYGKYPLPKGVVLKSGEIHSDGWCGPKFELRAAAADAPRCLKLSLLNPDFSPVFLDNDVTVGTEDETSRIEEIQPEQRVDLLLHIDEGEEMRARVSIGKSLPPSAFDARERAMKVLSAVWVEVKAEEPVAKPETAETATAAKAKSAKPAEMAAKKIEK